MARAESSKQCASERGTVDPHHPMLAGHFPGHPIVPGAWLLSWVIAGAMRHLAVAGSARAVTGVKRVKFLRPLGPSESFECELSTGSDTVRFTLKCAAGVIATGILQLQPQASS